jgi:hypothetical protein
MNKILSRLAVVGALCWAANPGPTPAQNPPNPYYSQNPYVTVQGGVGVPYPAYGYPYIYSPGSGNLYGAASVIDASGQYLQSVQQAKLGQQEVKKAKLDNKRAALDEWNYEQANTPTREEMRTRDREELLRHMRNDPTGPEVWTGQALNVLLQDLQRLQATRSHTEMTTLNPEMLKRINVTGSRNEANLGLLRDDAQLQWPYPLRAPEFDEDRKSIDQFMQKAVAQARSGNIAFDVLNGLTMSVDGLLNHLKRQIADMPSNQWTTAKRYADQLKDSVKTLQDPAVANYFNGQWQAKGNTVEELVAYMTSNGLRFAPGTQGDEAAYQSLYYNLRDYDTAIGQKMTRVEMTAKSNPPEKKSGLGNIFRKQ